MPEFRARFIGGPKNGEVMAIARPLPEIEVAVAAPLTATMNMSLDDFPEFIPVNRVIYRRGREEWIGADIRDPDVLWNPKPKVVEFEYHYWSDTRDSELAKLRDENRELRTKVNKVREVVT